MRQIDELVVAITGGGRGIGAAAARLFGGAGADVYICARSSEEIEAVAADEESIRGETVDITDRRGVREWMDSIEQQAGRLDVLINNAGVLGPRETLEHTDVDEWRRTIDVNVNGTFIVTRRAYPLLKCADSPMILNLSSSVGRAGRAEWGAYSVSKFAVEGLTEVAADELADHGGCVVSLNPGATATAMRANAYPDEDPSTLPEPRKIAATVGLLVQRLTPEQNGLKYTSRPLFELVGDAPRPEQIPTAGG